MHRTGAPGAPGSRRGPRARPDVAAPSPRSAGGRGQGDQHSQRRSVAKGGVGWPHCPAGVPPQTPGGQDPGARLLWWGAHGTPRRASRAPEPTARAHGGRAPRHLPPSMRVDVVASLLRAGSQRRRSHGRAGSRRPVCPHGRARSRRLVLTSPSGFAATAKAPRCALCPRAALLRSTHTACTETKVRPRARLQPAELGQPRRTVFTGPHVASPFFLNEIPTRSLTSNTRFLATPEGVRVAVSAPGRSFDELLCAGLGV